MTKDLRLQDLSKQAQAALKAALGRRPINLENVATLSVRDIWIMPGFGRKVATEIKNWAARHGVEMPETRPK